MTLKLLDRGQKSSQLLVQKQYHPLPVGKQIALLYCATHGLLERVTLDKIPVFEEKFLRILETRHQETVLDPLGRGEINQQIATIIESVAEQVVG